MPHLKVKIGQPTKTNPYAAGSSCKRAVSCRVSSSDAGLVLTGTHSHSSEESPTADIAAQFEAAVHRPLLRQCVADSRASQLLLVPPGQV